MMQRGYSAALVNGLEWADTKVVTTVLEHARSMTLDVSSAVSTLQHYQDHLSSATFASILC
jgi:hypothetical protein